MNIHRRKNHETTEFWTFSKVSISKKKLSSSRATVGPSKRKMEKSLLGLAKEVVGDFDK